MYYILQCIYIYTIHIYIYTYVHVIYIKLKEFCGLFAAQSFRSIQICELTLEIIGSTNPTLTQSSASLLPGLCHLGPVASQCFWLRFLALRTDLWQALQFFLVNDAGHGWMRPKKVTCSFSLPISSHFSWTSSRIRWLSETYPIFRPICCLRTMISGPRLHLCRRSCSGGL